MRKSQGMWCCTTPDEFIERLSRHEWELAYKKTKWGKTAYIDTTATLDIEDYATTDDGYIYSIAMCIDNERLVVRYMEDAVKVLERLCEEYNLSKDRRLVIYIHNLGHEHVFMTQLLTNLWGMPKALLVKPRKPLSIRWDNGIELRDSLRLFQKSLARATEGCLHEKMVGDLDYSVRRTPDTPLSPAEWNYIVNDVQGLYEAIERLKRERCYNQATIPLTNTGIVLDEVNKRVRRDYKCLKAMQALTLDRDQMRLAYKCMAGGDTHGTRWRAGRVYDWCNSEDLKSAHPSQQILRKFPAGEPITLDPDDCDEQTLDLLIQQGYGWLGKVVIGDLFIRPECPDPTISVSKCEDIEDLAGVDNGRVLGAKAVTVYMDSNDWQRCREGYEYSFMHGVEILCFRLSYLPDTFRGAVLDFFKVKEGAEDGPERAFAKICVNTIFGAAAQKVIRDEYTLSIDEALEVEHISWEDNLDKKTPDKVYNAQKNKLPFLWGLWTASLTRLYLWELIKQVGWESVIYWDTDSCKYEGDKVPEIDLIYNESVRRECIDRGAVVTNRDGNPVYIGTAEDEHPTVQYGYRRFTFLHAKCYAAEAWDKKDRRYAIETTISGVRKTNGAAALRGDIANLQEGLFIADAGGLALTYHDAPVHVRHDFKRPTATASWIEMQPRQYLVSGGIRDTVEEVEIDIVID